MLWFDLLFFALIWPCIGSHTSLFHLTTTVFVASTLKCDYKSNQPTNLLYQSITSDRLSRAVVTCSIHPIVIHPWIFATPKVEELRASLSEIHERRKQEDSAASSKLRAIAGRADELKEEVLKARAESAEKGRQLLKHRDEVCIVIHIYRR